MISFLPESWFPKKQNSDFHMPDRRWISPWIIQLWRWIVGGNLHLLLYFNKSTLRKGSFLYSSKPVEVGISGEAMLCTIVIYF